jgi:hypothetical protein
MRVLRRIPRRRWTASSSSPSFFAAQTNAAITTAALTRATTDRKMPSAIVMESFFPYVNMITLRMPS